MRELPILFSTEMVKAILGGRKSQTRRVVKPPPNIPILAHPVAMAELSRDLIRKAPYQVGDHLWVREKTLCWHGGVGGLSNFVFWDSPKVPGLLKDNPDLMGARAKQLDDEGEVITGYWKWRTGRFMFKWQARLWLEVTEVRVQRLQEITLEDCWDEGIRVKPAYNRIDAYRNLWDSLNGKTHPWASNPWVFCYSFKLR